PAPPQPQQQGCSARQNGQWAFRALQHVGYHITLTGGARGGHPCMLTGLGQVVEKRESIGGVRRGLWTMGGATPGTTNNEKTPPEDEVCGGVPEGIRTPGLLIRSQTLYPAELQAHSVGGSHEESVLGGEGEIRTRGRLLAYERLANAWFKPLTHLSMRHRLSCSGEG
ncbi:MAG: hypothetical protein JWQ08_2560, partial [Deinococcus sp.]|nr:hypothetical protein [Deinococcus sp.]